MLEPPDALNPQRCVSFTLACSRQECSRWATWLARPRLFDRDGNPIRPAMKPYCNTHLPKVYKGTAVV